jgi:hypothetical protein
MSKLPYILHRTGVFIMKFPKKETNLNGMLKKGNTAPHLVRENLSEEPIWAGNRTQC